MLNVVYLILVIATPDGYTSQSIPQANMAQCMVNAKNYDNKVISNGRYDTKGVKATCIAGVMPK